MLPAGLAAHPIGAREAAEFRRLLPTAQTVADPAVGRMLLRPGPCAGIRIRGRTSGTSRALLPAQAVPRRDHQRAGTTSPPAGGARSVGARTWRHRRVRRGTRAGMPGPRSIISDSARARACPRPARPTRSPARSPKCVPPPIAGSPKARSFDWCADDPTSAQLRGCPCSAVAR